MHLRKILRIIFLFSIFSICSCQPQQAQKCDCQIFGPNDVFASFAADQKKIVPFKANGNCIFKYRSKEKKFNQSFPVKLWLNPPDEFRLLGDVAFDARGIDLGSNRDVFWLALKPKELSSYQWGLWNNQKDCAVSPISPKILLEAAGVLDISDDANYVRRVEKNFFVAESSTEYIKKTVYINCCTNQISKIEYLKKDSDMKIILELDKYQSLPNGYVVPSLIKITTSDSKSKTAVNITLNSIKAQTFSDQQKTALFVIPASDGFENIREIVNYSPTPY